MRRAPILEANAKIMVNTVISSTCFSFAVLARIAELSNGVPGAKKNAKRDSIIALNGTSLN